MTCLCNHNKMFFSKGCWAYGHLDLWNKHPLMEQRLNSRATDNDTKQTETEQREGTSSGTSSLMTALVFMIVSKPTKNWDENVFLKPFTDVKIRSQSQLLEYTEGCQQRVMWRTKHQGKKKNISFIFCTKITQIKHVCNIYQQKHYLHGEACGLEGSLSKWIPLWKLEKYFLKLFLSKWSFFYLVSKKQKREFNVWKLLIITDM